MALGRSLIPATVRYTSQAHRQNFFTFRIRLEITQPLIFCFIFITAIFFATTHASAQSGSSNSSPRTLGPARVTPPDIFAPDVENSEAFYPGTAESSTAQQKKSTTTTTKPRTPINNKSLKNSSDDDDAFSTLGHEPVPHIKRRKDTDTHVRPESRFIEHPNAAKGLILIDKNKVYQYKVPTSAQSEAGSFRMGSYEPTELTNPNDPSLSFSNLYSTDFPFMLYDQEWQTFTGFGKFAWKAGGGLFLANGNGRFATSPGGYNQGQTPREKFTLFAFPLNLGAIYRLQYFKNQWVVPYGEGGVDAFCFGETRDDGKNPAWGARLGLAGAAHASAGVSVSLGKDARSFLDLDREYGINAVFLTVEYRRYVALSTKYDFSGNAFTGGITAEY